MSARGEIKTWHYGSTAVTLLVAYLLVLQGFAVGVSVSGRAGLFANSICFSKSSAPLSGDPASPARPARQGGDVCCVAHCASLGGATAASPFVGAEPPAGSYSTITLAFDQSFLRPKAATPPLGSRAPPTLI